MTNKPNARQVMLTLYLRDTKSQRKHSTDYEQLVHVAMCSAILDGTMDYNADDQTVTLTDYGLSQLSNRLFHKAKSSTVH